MFEEVGQIGERLDTQQETLSRQIAATERQVDALRSRAGSDAQKSIRLRELEREADAKRSQYGSMLQEMLSAAQRETFKRAPARVIARAVPPDEESSPRAKRLLVLAMFGGLVLGSGLGFLREMTDDRLRRNSDLRAGLGLRPLGLVPGIRPMNRDQDGVRLPAYQPTGRDQAQARQTLRAVIAQMQQLKPERGALITGLAAVQRGAGRGDVAGWLADRLAGSGNRVALLDLDLAHGPSERQLDLSQISASENAGDRIAQLLADADGPLVMGLPEGSDLLMPAHQADLSICLAALRPHLDHVLLILPPLSDRAEAEVAAVQADAALLVLRWGETSLPEASDALTASTNLPKRLFGAIFTAENARGFARYERS